MKEVKQHFRKKIFSKYWPDFLVLFLILLIGAYAFLHFSYSSQLQEIVIVILGLSYFLWGIVHHWRDRTLYFRVVLEYFMMAFWGVFFILFILLRL